MKSGFFTTDKDAQKVNRSGKVRVPPGSIPPPLTSEGDFPALVHSKASALKASSSTSPYNFRIPDAVQQCFDACFPDEAVTVPLSARDPAAVQTTNVKSAAGLCLEVVLPAAVSQSSASNRQERLPAAVCSSSAADVNTTRLAENVTKVQLHNESFQTLRPDVTNVQCNAAKATSAAPTKPSPMQWSSLFSAKPIEKNKTEWKSLFATKPQNAGRYVSKRFDSLGDCTDVLVPPQSVVDAGVEFWKDTLVGFFLDNGYGFYRVKTFLMSKWKLRGKWKIRFDKDLFFIEFSNPEDRRLVLEADPFVIDGKVFIITKWSPNVDCARENILSIPVWAKFSSIPSSFQSLEGLDWLACHLGELVCFDENTESRERLEFARALIEITPSKPLPTILSVALSGGRIGHVDIEYAWSPPICTFCHSFGHLETVCHHRPPVGVPATIPAKIPIQKPQPRQWKAKCPLVPPPDVPAGLQAFISSAVAIVDSPVSPVDITGVVTDIPDDTVAPYKGIFLVLDSDEQVDTAVVSDDLDCRDDLSLVELPPA